jgi:hypothetical protein
MGPEQYRSVIDRVDKTNSSPKAPPSHQRWETIYYLFKVEIQGKKPIFNRIIAAQFFGL